MCPCPAFNCWPLANVSAITGNRCLQLCRRKQGELTSDLPVCRPSLDAMAKCIPRNSCLPCIMRFFLFVEVCIGALFIIFALILQTPPKTAVPM